MTLGPKTKKNLEDAFAGESMARNKYTYFSSVARKAGYVQIANLFEETALNEKEHAKLWAKALGLISDTAKNLEEAANGEHFENTDMYPRMAAEADTEGHSDIAELFRRVGEVEKQHEARYKKLLANLSQNQIFAKPNEVKWKCTNCGHVHTGTEAPTLCPTCAHPQAYFEMTCENY